MIYAIKHTQNYLHTDARMATYDGKINNKYTKNKHDVQKN